MQNIDTTTVEGSRVPFNPHSPTPGRTVDKVNGLASAFTGCQQTSAIRSINKRAHHGEMLPDCFQFT